MLFVFLSHGADNKKPGDYLQTAKNIKVSTYFFKVCDMRKGENMPIFCQLIRQTFPRWAETCGLEHRVHKVATAAFWRTFSHEGKISPNWWGWGMHAHPLSLHFFFFWGGDLFLFFSSYNIQHCFICRPSDSTVPTDAGIEPRTVATSALAVRRSNH